MATEPRRRLLLASLDDDDQRRTPMSLVANLKTRLSRWVKSEPKPVRSIYGPEDTRAREVQADANEFEMEVAKSKGRPRGM